MQPLSSYNIIFKSEDLEFNLLDLFGQVSSKCGINIDRVCAIYDKTIKQPDPVLTLDRCFKIFKSDNDISLNITYLLIDIASDVQWSSRKVFMLTDNIFKPLSKPDDNVIDTCNLFGK